MPKKYNVPKEESTLQTKLGLAVRTCRRQLGLTQEELAWRAGIHRTYLADIERGKRNITLRSVASLARALQLTVADLMIQSSRGESRTKPVEMAPSLGDVLLVEDNPTDVELTQRAFARGKIANPLKVVRDGEEALHYLFETGPYANRAARIPQLVLLDLNLPKITGMEVLRRLRVHPLTRTTAVVILTVTRKDTAILEASRLGVAEYIIKPVNFEGIAEVVLRMSLRWALVPLARTGPDFPGLILQGASPSPPPGNPMLIPPRS